MNEAEARWAVEKLWNEAIEAQRLHYYAKDVAEVSKLLAASKKATARWQKASKEIVRKYIKGVTLDGIIG